MHGFINSRLATKFAGNVSNCWPLDYFVKYFKKLVLVKSLNRTSSEFCFQTHTDLIIRRVHCRCSIDSFRIQKSAIMLIVCASSSTCVLSFGISQYFAYSPSRHRFLVKSVCILKHSPSRVLQFLTPSMSFVVPISSANMNSPNRKTGQDFAIQQCWNTFCSVSTSYTLDYTRSISYFKNLMSVYLHCF